MVVCEDDEAVAFTRKTVGIFSSIDSLHALKIILYGSAATLTLTRMSIAMKVFLCQTAPICPPLTSAPPHLLHHALPHQSRSRSATKRANHWE
jgi:hypothetical protein